MFALPVIAGMRIDGALVYTHDSQYWTIIFYVKFQLQTLLHAICVIV